MSDLWLGQLLAGTVLAGTLVGIASLLRAGAGQGKPETAQTRRPSRWAEVTWPAGTAVIQAWSVGVLLAPGWTYAWSLGPLAGLDHGLQALGLVLWILGGALILSAGRALGRFTTAEIRVVQGHRLVREGPYRWIRHPMYTANVTLAVGIGLAFLHPIPLAVAAVLAWTARHRAILEEGLLGSAAGLGEAYEEYVASTGRFFPRIRRTA